MDNQIKRSVQTAEVRFWAKVERRDGCWDWRGKRKRGGYGIFNVGGKGVLAHRFSWRLHSGRDVPGGLLVCHHCDNPPCTNPSHLFVGTVGDNTGDMIRKGRGRPASCTPRGEAHGLAKLVAAEVQEIRRLLQKEPRPLIAARFGVCKSTINNIAWGRTWRHVQ